MTHEARFVTTGERSQQMVWYIFAPVRTKVANDASNVVAAEDITLVEHYQRDGKSQAQMDVDEVYLDNS